MIFDFFLLILTELTADKDCPDLMRFQTFAKALFSKSEAH